MPAGSAAWCTAVRIEPPPAVDIERVVQEALAEDQAFDDVTTAATVSPELQGTGSFVARQPGVVCGLAIAEAVFGALDPTIEAELDMADGSAFAAGDVLGRFHGPVRALLAGERTALNLVQRLSGIATEVSLYVAAVAHTPAVILDTRKTTPGLRTLEKYAVRCGGGTNHRQDLAAMAMIKDNHREALAREERSLADAVTAIREARPGIEVEVEVDSLDQLEAALAGSPEWVLLDNMTTADMAEAARRTAGRAKLEASGGVTLARVAEIAETGVDAISVGALTHSARAVDISMELAF